MLRTTVRDCLYLNWAFPAETLPPPPAPLRYQRHSWQGRDYVFASALLFHQDSLHLTALPALKFGYPQLTVRLYVLDDEGVPSVLFRRMLMPAWVAPGVRLITHQPAARARLHFPRPSRNGAGPWEWRAERKGRLAVRAWPDSPLVGEGPRLGSWEESVRYFQERPRGYALASGELQRISTDHPRVPTWPMRAEVEGDGLLPRLLDLPADTHWPGLHSVWLCPEIAFVFELGLVLRVPAAPALPQAAAAGRVVSFFERRPTTRRPPDRRRASC
ncbi:MAG TPA: DUF2071 domain-containing protein [Thermoanaerobaculia bacterium]|jgi:hypothetical protein|nr:DUF2071 domain-containing protein [Thermoanaerobaculia bacterium]